MSHYNKPCNIVIIVSMQLYLPVYRRYKLGIRSFYMYYFIGRKDCTVTQHIPSCLYKNLGASNMLAKLNENPCLPSCVYHRRLDCEVRPIVFNFCVILAFKPFFDNNVFSLCSWKTRFNFVWIIHISSDVQRPIEVVDSAEGRKEVPAECMQTHRITFYIGNWPIASQPGQPASFRLNLAHSRQSGSVQSSFQILKQKAQYRARAIDSFYQVYERQLKLKVKYLRGAFWRSRSLG